MKIFPIILIIPLAVLLGCEREISQIEHNKEEISDVKFIESNIIGKKALITKDNNPNLRISISPELDEDDRLAVDVKFHNEGNESLRILDYFDPIFLFFEFHMKDASGNESSLVKGGKVSIPFNLHKYVSVDGNNNFTKRIDMQKTLLDNDVVLADGRVYLKLVYKNQYGENCVKGQYESETIKLK